MSKIPYHDSVTVETEEKQVLDEFEYLDEEHFQFFGLSEKGIQTELTMRDINEIDNYNKELKEKNLSEQKILGKFEALLQQDTPSNNPNNKKDTNNNKNEQKSNNVHNTNLIDKLANKFIEPINDNNNNNNNKKNEKEKEKETNYSNYKINLSKNMKTTEKQIIKIQKKKTQKQKIRK